MQPIEFLERVLPDEGCYCFTTITGDQPDEKVTNTFVNSPADLLSLAKAHNTKRNIYYALASYETANRRTKANVKYLRSFWIDIDVRDKKEYPKHTGYETFAEVTEGLSKFIRTTGLPMPSIVYSGGGLHLYWPLEDNISQDKWLPYAEGLKRAAHREGFKIDPGITGDSARVLRIPGTFNIKRGTTSAIAKYTGTFPLARFDLLKMIKQTSAVEREVKVKKEKKEFDLIDSAPIFASCPQMRLFKEGFPEQTGEHWIACGRILALCHDGEKLWHDISEKDERYNESEAAKKWNDSAKFNNATLCERFETLNPGGCVGCVHAGKINTPIGIVRGKPISVEFTETIRDRLAIEKDHLPYGYFFASDGAVIHRSQNSNEDAPEEVKIANYPFYIKDRSRAELSSTDKSVIVESWNPKDGWSQHDILIGDLFLNPVVALAKVGIMITNDKMIRGFIRESYNQLAGSKDMIRVHETYGWKGDKFLLGDRLYRFENGRLAFETVQLGADAASFAPHLRPGGLSGKGSFQAWQAAAQGLFAHGHEWQAVTLLAGAGAPLLGLLDDPEGGTIWSLFDPVGGKGKTTATIAAACLWGGWPALSTAASDTINARIAKLGTLKHLPFAYDEMRRDNPGIAKQFVQTFTAGTERARMDKSGVLARMPRSWRTIMLTSANVELIGSIAADDGSEAMSDRVFEVHAENLPLRKGEIDGALKSEFMVNCGYAALPIIALMLRDLEEIKLDLRVKEKKYMTLFNKSKLRFRAQFAAVIDVMGHLLAKNNVLVFDAQYYVDWVLKHISEEQDIVEPANFPEIFARFLREYQTSTIFVKSFKPGVGKQIIAETRSGLCNVRVEIDTRLIYIPQKDISWWLQDKGHSYKAFCKEMKDKGILSEKNAKKNVGAGTQYSTAQEYVCIFKADHPELTGINAHDLEPTPINPAFAPRPLTLVK